MIARRKSSHAVHIQCTTTEHTLTSKPAHWDQKRQCLVLDFSSNFTLRTDTFALEDATDIQDAPNDVRSVQITDEQVRSRLEARVGPTASGRLELILKDATLQYTADFFIDERNVEIAVRSTTLGGEAA